MAKQTKIKIKKQVRKKFFPVEIPVLNKEIELLGTSIESLDNKHVKYDLTQMLRGKALELKLIVKATKKEATTEPIEIKLQGFYLRRIMRRGIDYSEDSFYAQCKEHRIKVKHLAITRNRVSRRVLKALRNEAKKLIQEYSKDKSFDSLVLDVINNKLQKEIMVKLKKIYPLAAFEIKFLGIKDLKEHEKLEQDSK